jgi:sporulation protein YqfC
MCGIFMDKKDLKARIADASGVPKDVVLGVPLVTVIGQNEVCVENYRGILEYTDKLIRIQTKLGKIHVLGRGLQIQYYNNDEMKITGHVMTIEYYEGG